ncbi:MAG: glycosyltransferase [SAR324 cluster bacterium]|jgi:glycosyltransferase involved in cell wall biosynthesis|nr:glycosyltransferase [SAR324 cluster bacterium]MEC7888046.1 glycosyltransferase [SAR324 cluster bacterium]MEC9296547.1 glycosyltransferase [SAR324 cluster bacterium]MEE3265921.1 glycosyltransferase [SAR324 cluster bacterium]
MPQVTVILPSWNRADWLKKSIDSVLEQTFRDFELIVVDDASTDSTQEILTSYSGKIRSITFSKNLGVSAARNAAVKNCDSEWIAFLDSDDFWHPHKLQKQIAQTVIRAECPIHFTDEIWIRNGVRVNPKKKHQKLEGWIFKPSLELCLMSPSTVLLRRELFDVHGLFDETLPICEDYDLWLRLTSQHQVALLNEKLMTRHGGHADQLSRSDWGIDRYRVQSIIKILKTEKLSPEDRSAAIVVLRKKCEIIINGFRKRGKLQEIERYEKIATQHQIY